MRIILTAAALTSVLVLTTAAVAADYNAADDMRNAGGSGLSEPMVVTVDNGNVREAPNTQSKILTTVARGQQVTLVAMANGGGWAHVNVDGLNGYMDMVQLAKAPYESSFALAPVASTPSVPGPRYMIVTTDNGRLHQNATSDGALLMALPRGSQVAVLGTSGSWAYVRYGGVEGYIDQTQLSDVAPTNGLACPPAAVSASSPYSQTYPSYHTTPGYSYNPSAPTYSYRPSYQPAATYVYPNTPMITTDAGYQPMARSSYQTSTITTYPVYPTAGAPAYPSAYQSYPTYRSSTPANYVAATRFVNGGGGTLYLMPDGQSSLIATLAPGTQVSVMGTANGSWAHVVSNGYDGYIPLSDLQ